jgi:hypothetical protein
MLAVASQSLGTASSDEEVDLLQQMKPSTNGSVAIDEQQVEVNEVEVQEAPLPVSVNLYKLNDSTFELFVKVRRRSMAA